VRLTLSKSHVQRPAGRHCPRSQAIAHGAVTARLETNRAPPVSGFAGPEQRVPAVTLGHEVFAVATGPDGGLPFGRLPGDAQGRRRLHDEVAFLARHADDVLGQWAACQKVAAASGFNEKGVNQLAETVHGRVDDFLLAVGFNRLFVAARELISDEIARVLR
jgi:hypothetical protein